MDYEKLKKLLIKNMNINEKTMHVLSMGEYVKRITVKEFFEVLENAINNVEKDESIMENNTELLISSVNNVYLTENQIAEIAQIGSEHFVLVRRGGR